MTKADTLDLVTSFSLEQADVGSINRYYDDLVRATADRGVLVEISTLAVSVEQGTFTIPTEAMRLLHVFYGDRMLDEMRLLDIEVISDAWRDMLGDPLAYVQEHESERTFRLWPRPDKPSDSYNPLLGPPFGEGLPAYNVFVVWTETRDFPVWLELPVSLRILQQEFNRESRHTDQQFATACEQVAQVLEALINRS